MLTSPIEIDVTAVQVELDEDTLRVILADGREIAVPLAWFPRLLSATPGLRSLNSMLPRWMSLPTSSP